MTARDDAIKALIGNGWGWCASPDELLDAIPDDVLVRLAIERGVLVKTTRTITTGSKHLGGGRVRNEIEPLYRVVES